MKDVAREAGVSTATVSRVLNSKGALSAETIEKVKRAIETLDYHPNSVARTLVKGKQFSLGVMLPSLVMPFWAELANELERAAESRGYNLIITSAPPAVEDYISKYEALRARMPDGIITSYIADTEDFIYHSGLPTVIVSNSGYHPSIASNDDQGGTLATRHLIAKGCKSLVHISGPLKSKSSGNARSFAFVQECEKANIPYRIYETTLQQQRAQDYAAIVNNVFYDRTDFDGIFASNDVIAARCVAMALSMGYSIPQDVRIVGYDDISLSRLLYPSLTTIRQDYTRLAECALDTLLQRINGQPVPDRQVIPVTLMERKTT